MSTVERAGWYLWIFAKPITKRLSCISSRSAAAAPASQLHVSLVSRLSFVILLNDAFPLKPSNKAQCRIKQHYACPISCCMSIQAFLWVVFISFSLFMDLWHDWCTLKPLQRRRVYMRTHTQARLWNFLYNTSDQIRPIALERCLAESHCIYWCSQIEFEVSKHICCVYWKSRGIGKWGDTLKIVLHPLWRKKNC